MSVYAPRVRGPLLDRFNAKWEPEPNTGCWLWTAALNAAGYGLIGISGRSRLATRIGWALLVGALPDTLCVLHRCDTPACVNPDHLFLGTRADNAIDMARKGRNGTAVHPETVARGEQHGRSKLTVTDVLAIRASTDRCTSLARRYETTHKTIRDVQTRRTWRHVA